MAQTGSDLALQALASSPSLSSREGETDTPGVRVVEEGIGGAGLEPLGPAAPTTAAQREIERLQRNPVFRSLPPYTKKLAIYLLRRYYQQEEGIIVSLVTLETKLEGTKLKATRKTIRRHLSILVDAGLFTRQERMRPAHWVRHGQTSSRYRVHPNLPSRITQLDYPAEVFDGERVSSETKETSLHSVGAGSTSSPAEALNAGMTKEILALTEGPTSHPSRPPVNTNSPASVGPNGGASGSGTMKADHELHQELSLAELEKDLAKIEGAPGSTDGFTPKQRAEIRSVHPWLSQEWAFHVWMRVVHGEEWGIHIENPVACFLAGLRSGKRPA